MNKATQITLLICTHNGSETIEQVLDYISQQIKIDQDELEVLVVDNNSTDHTAEIATQTIQDLNLNGRVIFESKLGKTNALIKGIQAASSPIVSIIDDDNFIEVDFVYYTLNIFNQYPSVYLVGSNNSIYTNHPVPEWFNWVQGRYACGHALIEEVEQQTDDGIIIGNSGFVSGAGSSIRIQPLKQCLNKGYLFFNNAQHKEGRNTIVAEDIELCFLMRSLGCQFAYDPRIRVRHAIHDKRLNVEYLEKYSKDIGAGFLGFEPFLFTYKSSVNSWSLKWTWQWQLLSKVKHYLQLILFPDKHTSSEVEHIFTNKLHRLECQGAIERILKERHNYTKHIHQVAFGEWTEFRVR